MARTAKTKDAEVKKTAKKEKAPKAKKAIKKASNLDAEQIKSLKEIEHALLRKAKSKGSIDQSEIYDALNNYELDDEAIEELMNFCA